MIIKCTPAEKTLLKRSIKADKCKVLCEYRSLCTKPDNMTCGEYILSLIEWEIEE
jgi:hypothetical protein